MNIRCNAAIVFHLERGTDGVTPGATPLPLSGNIEHVLDADTTVTATGQTTKLEDPVLT